MLIFVDFFGESDLLIIFWSDTLTLVNHYLHFFGCLRWFLVAICAIPPHPPPRNKYWAILYSLTFCPYAFYLQLQLMPSQITNNGSGFRSDVIMSTYLSKRSHLRLRRQTNGKLPFLGTQRLSAENTCLTCRVAWIFYEAHGTLHLIYVTWKNSAQYNCQNLFWIALHSLIGWALISNNPCYFACHGKKVVGLIIWFLLQSLRLRLFRYSSRANYCKTELRG